MNSEIAIAIFVYYILYFFFFCLHLSLAQTKQNSLQDVEMLGDLLLIRQNLPKQRSGNIAAEDQTGKNPQKCESTSTVCKLILYLALLV